MKKSLIALAVLAAAGSASAQSSVTLFGIVDATIQRVDNRGGGTITRLTNSGYNSSRLGFRGTEDLGGGMSASFWLEAGLANDDGQGAATNSNNQPTGTGAAVAGRQGLTFNRRSTVSLAGGWGEVRLGRDYTPQFWNLTVFDPFGTNGTGTTQTLNGVSIPLAGLVPGGAAAAAAFPGSIYSTQVRASNSIGYFLPGNLGGFYGQLQYYMGENDDTSPIEDAGRGAGLRLGYAAGPINVAVALSRTDFGAGTITGDITTANIGAQWDFGFAKLMAHYNRDTVEAGGAEADINGFLVGALVPVGAGEIRVSYSQSELDAGTEPRSRKLALGYVHNLSKRTALYTTYARVRNNGGANSSAVPGAATAPTAGSASNGFDLGVRHSF
ncbi:MAG: Outer membrane porin protein 32 precursor [uncultured Ramlibacter sp.]|uniref:Outer membrane porin protein 32 n=1 Tax=uncultured Ramlibacter sp. TaxID=260755 RepID=A0A6J4Q7Z1_9BURK|nr:MAG: Outer membrane porin protein 32 precursor [uncultured Ramlibacter sp.]